MERTNSEKSTSGNENQPLLPDNNNNDNTSVAPSPDNELTVVINDFKWTPAKRIFIGLVFAAVAIEPLYAKFLADADKKELDAIQKEAGLDELKNYYLALALSIAFKTVEYGAPAANLMCDFLSVNIPQEGIDILELFTKDYKSRFAKIFTSGMVLFSLAGMMTLAGADAVAFATLTDNKAAQWLVGGATALLGTLFYVAFTRGMFEDTAALIEKSVKNPRATLKNIATSGFTGIEAGLQMTFANLYRSTAGGSTAVQLAGIAGLSNSNLLKPAVIGVFGNTYIATLLSRNQKVLKAFFSPDFYNITDEHRKKATIPYITMSIDTVIGLLRGGAVGWLANSYLPLGENVKITVAAVAGVTASAHYIYTLAKRRLNEAAVDVMKNEKIAADVESQNKADHSFDALQKHYEFPKTLSTFNSGATIARALAFRRFLHYVVTTVGITNLSYLDSVALALLIAPPTLLAERLAYKDGMKDALSAAITKAKIAYVTRDADANTVKQAFGIAKRYAELFFTPKEAIPQDQVDAVFETFKRA